MQDTSQAPCKIYRMQGILFLNEIAMHTVKDCIKKIVYLITGNAKYIIQSSD